MVSLKRSAKQGHLNWWIAREPGALRVSYLVRSNRTRERGDISTYSPPDTNARW